MTHMHYPFHLGTSLRWASACLSTSVPRAGSYAPGKISCPTSTVHNSLGVQEACLSKDMGCSPAEAWMAMSKAHASLVAKQLIKLQAKGIAQKSLHYCNKDPEVRV